MKKDYVVTDPCYILPKDIWNKCIEVCEEYAKDSNWSDMFNKEVENALKEFTQGQAFVESTGFGDWDNQLLGPNVKNDGGFTADAGMVCVCELTGAVHKALGNAVEKESAAVFMAQGPINVQFDTSKSDWTIVNIEDSEGECWTTWEPDDDNEEEDW